MYDISLSHSFDSAHRVVGHKGKCARLHGHTYLIEVRIVADTLVDPGFVADFGDIKDVINRWDHRCLLWDDDPLVQVLANSDVDYGTVLLPFNPTSEHMSRALAEMIHIDLGFAPEATVSVKLQETPKSASYAVFGGGSEVHSKLYGGNA